MMEGPLSGVPLILFSNHGNDLLQALITIKSTPGLNKVRRPGPPISHRPFIERSPHETTLGAILTARLANVPTYWSFHIY